MGTRGLDKHLGRGYIVAAFIALLLLLAFACTAFAQPAAEASPATQAAVKPPNEIYGLWTLLPALVAIGLAIITRQVVVSLSIGVLVAALMGLPWSHPAGAGEWQYSPLRGIQAAVETYLIGAVTDAAHVKIMVFTLLIGGAVGVMAASGGTRAVVNLVVPWASNRRRGQIVTWLAGLVVFFDDYSNAMVVGPTMRPLTDRLRISREKLAYIVDSTAAPVASIALIGTWLGAEVGYIQDGFAGWTDATRPAFLNHVDGTGEVIGAITGLEAFYKSIPYRFYAILALFLVFWIGWSRRDYGSMLTAERRAWRQGAANEATTDPTGGALDTRRWWYAAAPIFVLVGMTLWVLIATGLAGMRGEYDRLLDWLGALLGAADAYNSILYGGLAMAVIAVGLSVGGRVLTFRAAIDALTDGMSRMFGAIVVLVLAWALSSSIQALHLADVATRVLRESQFSPQLLPFAVFVAAGLVSFATGTSWGTMGILCPVTVSVAGGLLADLPAETALGLFYGSVGSVLAGAIFGDHCSPISDTTVLSSTASQCELGAHVWTQMPYALVCAVLSMLCGNLLCGYTGLSPWIGVALGIAGLMLISQLVGRRVEAESSLA